MPEQLLHGPNVVAGREEVGREAVAKYMRGHGLGDTRPPNRPLEDPLNRALGQSGQ